METVDVVVAGAGLAGLRCASILHDAGLDVVVLESSDGVGGRVRTDRVDGFLLDRGFQVVNPWYPALRAAVDVDALGLQRFAAGARVLTDDGLRTLADPLRVPTDILATLRNTAPRPTELWALARWATPLLTGMRRDHGLIDHLLRARPDTSLQESLDRAGAHGLLRATLQRYLAGVVLEDAGETSAAFAMLLVRSFVRGTPGLPRDGADALPRAIAVPLGERVRLGEAVERSERTDDGVRVTSSGATYAARRLVVATDPWTAESLLDSRVVAPRPKGVVTDWYAVGEPPTTSGMLHLDVRDGSGPAINTCVVSVTAPSYAPAGRHLIQVTSLLPAGGSPAPEPETRRHAAAMLGTSGRGWDLILRHEVPRALPAQPAPLQARREQRVDEATWVCGDHRDTASQQGALVGGARAAHDVLRSLQRKDG
ncbi:Phytoene dehydrogenase-related protein [Nocardioides terrae]|uniref:Phytoene dehydrogenase-related protein n=1 Tax=Nocardioides terrae TaxID=574651 RepID=A0A1I1KE74_9ACTN|nr:NAD(P)/FAD-dependent oxidoreductase [Nocardioides terrae]SFC58921.1 Phytoene dehydrogenase-related protein [Nocardioides terrae]